MIIDNHQGGDNENERDYYSYSLDYIGDNTHLLNIGSGSMIFENFVKQRFPNISITSIDMDNHFEKYSHRTDKFLIVDIEKPFTLGFYNCITCFEVIEHIDNTDELLRNCYNNLKEEGFLILSFPNLSSFYSRIELLFGYQPHILEVSNTNPLLGSGIFGRLNNKIPIFGELKRQVLPLHHIRGFTFKAMKEFLTQNGFVLVKSIGSPSLFGRLPSIAPKVIIICKKEKGRIN